MKVAVTGATGLIGRRLVAALLHRGDEVVILSRRPSSGTGAQGVPVMRWDPLSGPAPGLTEVDAVVHLAGEPIAQRWTAAAKERIRASRVTGTRNLVAGLTDQAVLVSTSAAGYYGDRGDAILDESAAPGDDFLASVCREWETAAQEAPGRVVIVRNGVVLDKSGGALAKMLLPFRLGLGGPVAGGRQWMPWIALDDVVGIYLAALSSGTWSGPVNASAPEPTTNKEFTEALGRALHRPAVLPVPAFGLKLLFGEMASVLTTGQRMLPAKAQALGYEFRHPRLDDALAAALASG